LSKENREFVAFERRLRRQCEKWAESDNKGRIGNGAAFSMSYISGEKRGQAALLPAAIEDCVAADAPV
jgi:hypothetical protein